MSDSTTSPARPRRFVVNAAEYIVKLLGTTLVFWLVGQLPPNKAGLDPWQVPGLIGITMVFLGVMALKNSAWDRQARADLTTNGNLEVYRTMNIVAIVVGASVTLVSIVITIAG